MKTFLLCVVPAGCGDYLKVLLWVLVLDYLSWMAALGWCQWLTGHQAMANCNHSFYPKVFFFLRTFLGVFDCLYTRPLHSDNSAAVVLRLIPKLSSIIVNMRWLSHRHYLSELVWWSKYRYPAFENVLTVVSGSLFGITTEAEIPVQRLIMCNRILTR